jgi:hypothetical protein
VIPYRETDDPYLQKPRIDRELPIIAKSKTLRLEPNFDIPNTESPDPQRTKLRMEKEDPRFT